ncbi:uncharacterized protein LOC127847936 isoform X5 [Dreissena polymorpha]|nr:uncharacterized protein LOC127847936 isoform X5 [Dreissena polymorpha]
MHVVILTALIGAVFGAQPHCDVVLPHGHQLTVMVDGGFARMDNMPQDGKITTAEFDYIITLDDKNNDTCVSFAEYHNAETQALFFEINQKMYSHFDPDNDDCLDIDEMNAEFHKIDKNADGLLEKPEFEHYYTTILRQLFPCHGHGRKYRIVCSPATDTDENNALYCVIFSTRL